MSAQDWNAQIIAEFHKNHGKVGGNFQGAPLLILHTRGARSSKPHVNPVMYLQEGDRIYVFASKAGADTHPDWYHNLKAHPDIQVEFGDEKVDVHAKEVVGPERDRIYKKQATLFPSFGEYERKTKRKIPVVELILKKK
jgi:deazaflavin-dependent oxidoreductase (nitroreductase family)